MSEIWCQKPLLYFQSPALSTGVGEAGEDSMIIHPQQNKVLPFFKKISTSVLHDTEERELVL